LLAGPIRAFALTDNSRKEKDAATTTRLSSGIRSMQAAKIFDYLRNFWGALVSSPKVCATIESQVNSTTIDQTHESFMKCKSIALLSSEHKIILRTIDVLESMAKQAEAGKEFTKEDVNGIIEILRIFADELHQAKEENVLFPVFTKACDSSETDAIRHMLFEHEKDRSLIERLQNALLRSQPAEFAGHASYLAEILRTHIYKEDNILFDLIDKRLSDEDDVNIVREFQGFDRDFKTSGHDRLLHRLRMLEWKYMNKAA
jgi:hemerythrin-like domain-containing protein